MLAAGGARVALDVEALYRRFGPMVLRRCRAMLRDEAQAVDAMQDTFVQVLRYKASLDDQAPGSLLYRIATNVCLNRIRSRARRPEDAAEDLLVRIADQRDDEGRIGAGRVLDRLFSRFQTSTRTIAMLHLVDGLTLEEVAAEVGLSVSGVRKRLRSLKAGLAELEGV